MRRLETFALVLAFLLTLSACGGDPPEAQDLPSQDPEDVTLYDCSGLQAALPVQYIDKLRIETEFPDFHGRWRPLISVYDRASWENSGGTGGGFLFGLAQLDQASFEQTIGADGSGADVFATDGEDYYVYTYATDVQFCRSTPDGTVDTESADWKEWEELNEIGPAVREDFLSRNGLQSFSMKDFMEHMDTGAEDHVCVRYYPYFVTSGDTSLYYQLLLRQPAQQGEGGLWAVDQWLDEFGNQSLYFPDSGMPAAEYYARLQEQCGAGEHPEYQTPAGAAAVFVQDYFGHEAAEGSFTQVPELDLGYTERNKTLGDLALDVMFGRDVDDMTLLDCVGGADMNNWGTLSRYLYGSDWFDPLMDAVTQAAVGENQPWRTSVVFNMLVTTRDAQTDFRTPLNTALRRQREADPESFSETLALFLPECGDLLDSDLTQPLS